LGSEGLVLAVLVSDITNPRVCKIGYALKLQGWRVVLLHRDELVLGTTSLSFDETTRFRTPDEALQQTRLIAPAVCHVFSCWNFEVASLFVAERPAPVIFDDYDVLAGMVNERFLDANYPGQTALERYCLERADAICCRSLELQCAKRHLGYRISSPMIFLQDYCWDLPDPQHVPHDRSENEIHIVYCGNLAAEKQHLGHHRRNGFFLELAVSLARVGIHFHIYPSPINRGVFEDTFSVHLELAARTEFFHLHRPVPPDRLIVEISRYDLGLQSSWQGSWDDGDYRPIKYQYATANKLFDYFDAGLGVVVDERRFQRHLAKRMRACVEASYDNMAERLISMPADFWRQLRPNALRARTAYSMRRHAPRLAALYESLAVGGRLVSGPCNADTPQPEQPAGTMAHSIKSAQIQPANGDLTGAGIMRNGQIRLYAGDIPASKEYNGRIGLSLTQENDRHIRHDITPPLPFPDNLVDALQAGAIGISMKMPQNSHAKTETTPASNTKLVKISFVMIVLNGMPFVEYALKAIYGEAHEIIIVEGAVEECFFAANPDGSSIDGTVECIRSFSDPHRKIRLIQGRWPEKCEMQNAALTYVTGNYVWLVDSDEIYKREDISKIRSLLADDPTITQVNVIGDNFWKGFDYIFESPKFFETPAHWRRIFKYVRGARFTTHRPPTMVFPGHELSTEQMHLIDGTQTRAMGIVPFHYSYVLESQVKQKIELYNRYGWGRMWNLDLNDWYNNFYVKWRPENRYELERLYPIWTGDPHSYSVPFTGTHPEVMEELITACRSGELSSQIGSDEKTPRAPDEQDALAKAGAANCNPSKKFKIAGEGVVGSDLTQIQEGSGFETSLRELVLSIKPRTIIETGTYLGNGTTRIVATALRDAGLVDTTFYSIECNPLHHRQAYCNLDQAGLLPFVKPLLGLSVPRNLLPSVESILDDTVRNVVEDGIFVDHQEQDRAGLYYRETDFPDIPEDLIGACLEQFGSRPDLVLLDSAGHMGSVEFEYVVERLQGECYLVLDDIRHVKHYRSFQMLQKDPRFTVITSSDEKFGFCIARFNPGTRVESTAERRWILWIRPDSIGDNILAMATLPHLRARRPDAAIAVFCQEHIAELYEACPAVDRVITFNRMRALQDEAYLTAVLRQLQELRADICLNSLYSRDLLADFFATRSGAQERIALMGDLSNTSAADREAYNRFYTSILTSAGEHKPEIERHQDFLRGIGITGERLKPSIWTFPDDTAFSDRFFKEQGFEPEKTLALFAGAQFGVRLYDKYGAGLAAFCRENGFSVVALGSAGDYGINQHNLDAIGVTTANLSGATTLRQGAAILSRCRLAVGAETGLAHMACAVGTPNIIVLGGGHFGRFIPYSPLTSVICLPLECYGCNWSCRYERVHCVRDVSPAVIAEALRHSLAGRPDHIRYFVQGDSLWKPEDGGPARNLSARFMLVEGEIIMVDTTNGN